MSASVQGPRRNPQSWILVPVITAFMAGGIAMIVQMWWLFWVCTSVIFLSLPAGRLITAVRRTTVCSVINGMNERAGGQP
jgi:hypothetical protein